jgi:hypothetical protein
MTAVVDFDRDPVREMSGPLTSRLARAYCGPAHGWSWSVREQGPPPADVVLEVAAQTVTYRLVRHPRSHRPARDQRGHYLYMPLLYSSSR